MRSQIPQATEHQIQTQIINYLRFHGWYVQRLNSGKLPIGEGRSRRMVHLGEAGTPDLMCFKAIPEIALYEKATHVWKVGPYIQLVFIEVKRKGKKPTLLQQLKMQELSAHGAKCFVATSIEDVEKELGL